jgi:hypothetical protein
MSFRDVLDRIGQSLAQGREDRRVEIRFWRRADLLVALFIGVTAVLGAVAGFGLASIHESRGLFDGPLAEPLKDQRILTNIRSHRSDFVDAAILPAENTLYAIRRSGTIHRLKLSTMLWSDESLRGLSADLTTDVALLQPGCGHHTSETSPFCADDDVLFAVTEGGGVAMRRASRWTMLLGDTQFTGRDGRPVAMSELRSSAVSPDKKYLLLGTETQGIGVFDLVRRRWERLPPEIDEATIREGRPLPITHLVPISQHILVGTSRGLLRLQRSGNSWQAQAVAGVAGRVIDIVDGKTGTFVLSAEACSNETASECIGLRRLMADGTVRFVAGEIERLSILSDASVFHVVADGSEIVALGQHGIYSYVTAERRWISRETKPVTNVWQAAAGGALVYSHADEIVRVESFRSPVRHPLAGVRDIVPGSGRSGMPLVLTDSNHIYQLQRTDKPRPLLDESLGRFPLADYQNAVEVADSILYFGPAGALVHNPRLRTYRSIERDAVPAALIGLRSPLKSTGNVIWLAQERTLAAFEVEVDPSKPSITPVAPVEVALPLRSIVPNRTKPNSLFIVDRDGLPFEAFIDRRGQSAFVQLRPLLGPGPSAIPGNLVDAIAGPTAVILGTNHIGRDLLWRYDLSKLAWEGPVNTGLGAEPLTALAVAEDGLHVLGRQGSVVRAVGQGATGGRRFGADTPLPFDSTDLTDAMAAPPVIALAGRGDANNGMTVLYDTANRRLVSSFPVPFATPRIAGVIGGRPVVYDGAPAIARRGSAWHGQQSLVIDGAPAITASVRGNQILTTHRDSGGRVFLAERGTQGQRCLFRQSDLMAKDIFDVREISGRLALLTDQGLRFYVPTERRFVAEATSRPAGVRLAVLENHIATYDDRSVRFIPLSGQGALTFPSSCDHRPLVFGSQPLEGRQVTVDEPRSRVAILSDDGTLRQWERGQLTTQLPPANIGPEVRTLRRLAGDGDEVHFGALDAVHTYNLVTRRWQSSRLTAPQPLTDVGLTFIRDGNSANRVVAVTGTDRDGNQYWGILSSQTTALTPIPQSAIPAAPFNPRSVHHIQELAPHLWAFLSENELAVLDVRQRKWIRTVTFDRPSTDRKLHDWSSHWAIIEGNEARPTRIALIPQSRLLEGDGQPLPLSSIAYTHELTAGEQIALIETRSNADRTFELLRQLATDETVSCPLRGPGTISDCRRRVPPALQINASDVDTVFSWSEYSVHINKRGRAAFINRRDRTLQDITPDLAKLGTDQQRMVAEIVNNELWLRVPRGSVLSVSRSGIVRELLDQADEVFAVRGRIWASTRDGLRLARDGAFLSPAATAQTIFPNHPDASALVLDANGLAIGIRRNRTIVYEFQGRTDGGAPEVREVSAVPIWDAWREQLRLVNPLPIQRGTLSFRNKQEDGWWVRQGRDVHFVTRGQCHFADPWMRDYYDCPRSLIAYRLPDDQAVIREITNDQPPIFHLLINGTPAVFRGTAAGGALNRASDQPRPPRRAGEVAANRAEDFKQSIVDGLLDRSTMKQEGESVIIRYGAFTQSTRGQTSGPEVPSLKRPWIEWRRDTRQFRLRPPEGQAFDVPPLQLFPERIFAPTVLGTVLPSTRDEIVIANAHGLWRWPVGGDLVERGPTWRRIDAQLPRVVAATNSRFYFATGSISRDGAAIERDSDSVDVRREGLHIMETVRSASIAASLAVGGNPANAFADRGFLHDQRYSVAIDQSGIVLLTKIGILRASGYGNVLPLPPSDSGETRLFNHAGEIHADGRSRGIFKWIKAGWTAVSDPRSTGSLHKDAGWTWTRSDGRVVLEGADWRIAHKRWRFATDSVIGAAYGAQNIVLVTEDGSRSVANFTDLAALRNPDVTTSTGDGERIVETRFASPGLPVVGIVDSGGMQLTWDDKQRDWMPASLPNHPDRQRVAVDDKFLEIVFRQNRPSVSLHAEHISRINTLIPVTWRRQQPFPFDFAHAIGSDGRRLFVGTSSALQIVDLASGTVRIIDTRQTVEEQPTPVVRIGRPAAAPQRFLGQGPGGRGCVDLAHATPSFCSDVNALAERTLGATPFWSWTYSDSASMRYLDRSGKPIGPGIRSIPLEGFPHDRLTSINSCRNQMFSLWNGGAWVTEVDGPGLAVGQRTATDVLLARTDQLHCQEQSAVLGDQQLAAGIYASSGGWAYRRDGTQWVTVNDGIVRAVAERTANRIPYERGRLRLKASGSQALTLEYRNLADAWVPLRTSGGRYAVDLRSKLLVANNTVWAVTRDGLVRLTWSADDLLLDPDDLSIVPLPSIRGRVCDVDRIEQADGSGIALALEQDKPIVLRCADGTVLNSTTLGAADDGGFKPRPADPFLERTVIGSPNSALRWQITDRRAGTQGRLRLLWGGEPTNLTGGRFQADVLRSVASFQSGILDFATEQGWARAPEQSMTLADSARPTGRQAEAQMVRIVARDKTDDGVPFLCLAGTDGNSAFHAAYRSDGAYEPNAGCGRHDALEGGWNYRSRLVAGSSAHVAIRGLDSSGISFDRLFIDGRFSDLVASGGPVIGRSKKGTHILVPTQGGVTVLNLDGQIGGPIHRSGGEKRLSLFVSADGAPHIVTENRLERVDDRAVNICPAAAQAFKKLGPASSFVSISASPEGRWEFVARREGQRIQMELPCSGTVQDEAVWLTLANIGHRPRLKALGDSWRSPPQVAYEWRNGQLFARRNEVAGSQLSASAMLVDGPNVPLRILRHATNVILVTEREIYRIDLDRTISALARSVKP